MARHVWVVEYRTKQGGWRYELSFTDDIDARNCTRRRSGMFPTREYRVVKYVPAPEPDDDARKGE